MSKTIENITIEFSVKKLDVNIDIKKFMEKIKHGDYKLKVEADCGLDFIHDLLRLVKKHGVKSKYLKFNY